MQMEKEGRKRIMTKYKWLETKYRIGIFIITKHLCSNCAKPIEIVDYPEGLPNKCPHCGAEMEESE